MQYNGFKNLKFISNIRSVAVIGISRRRNYYWLSTFVNNFKNGPVYAIKPGTDKIEEYPEVHVFPRVIDIPENEHVDFVFISLPRDKVIDVIDDCIQKKVKLVAIFSSNFADEGTEKGRELQRKLFERIKGTETRVLGPNCLGLYYPRLGISWRSPLPVNETTMGGANVGIVAQSGGLCNLLIYGLTSEGVNLSKVFSIGNSVDVNLLDVLNYFKNDPETHIIIMYIEGIKKNMGGVFLKLLRECSKPVLIVKAGSSNVGLKAAITHTAVLIGNYSIWETAIKQAGGILVETFEDLTNTAGYFIASGLKKMEKISLISISGGYGVICSDILVKYGLELPNFKAKTMDELSKIITASGTSFNNPIDLAGMLYEFPKLERTFRTIMEDDLIDGIVFEIAPLYLVFRRLPEMDFSVMLYRILKKLRLDYNKPILVIIQDIGFLNLKNHLSLKLQSIGIPVFSGIMPIARTLKVVNEYFKRKN
ncbi:MAG: CoA-binding protein [Promethearchaeota archaeon]